MSWKVKIDDEYGIKTDSNGNYSLCKFVDTFDKNKGEKIEQWNGFAHFHDEIGALEKYIEIQKLNANITELSEIKGLYEELNNRFDELRKELGV
ncbi:MAG: hypothetical protein ACOCZ5_01900 [bacterium]